MPEKKEEAQRLLSHVDSQKVFWLEDGKVIRNVIELAETIENMADDQFRRYVNKDKNDFASWIRDVIMDIDLSKDIQKLRTREVILKVIRKRISDLSKIANA